MSKDLITFELTSLIKKPRIAIQSSKAIGTTFICIASSRLSGAPSNKEVNISIDERSKYFFESSRPTNFTFTISFLFIKSL